jgi:hypothetical protein
MRLANTFSVVIAMVMLHNSRHNKAIERKAGVQPAEQRNQYALIVAEVWGSEQRLFCRAL